MLRQPEVSAWDIFHTTKLSEPSLLQPQCQSTVRKVKTETIMWTGAMCHMTQNFYAVHVIPLLSAIKPFSEDRRAQAHCSLKLQTSAPLVSVATSACFPRFISTTDEQTAVSCISMS